MQLAERAPSLQAPEIDRELRIRTDTTTWLAETLHGSMQTKFEFTFDGEKLRGEDGGELDEIFDEAISEAKIMTQWNPSLLFELRRRLIERDELGDMYRMVNGELPNTMIVMSDFPPELMNANEDVGGYNVSRQQTMMRIITLGEDGKLSVTSQSLDGSNRKALETVYAAIGEPVKEGELLGQRVYRDMSAKGQDKLVNNLTQVHDDSLTEQFGGEWHAGISQRPDRNMLNTYDFVLGQHDLINWFTKEKLANPVGAEKLRYKLAATAKSRHEEYLATHQDSFAAGEFAYESLVTARSIVSSSSLLSELERAGIRAARRGMVFSGCGASISAETDDHDDLTTPDNMRELGYGNKAGSDKFGSLKFKCKKGHNNTRPHGKLIEHCKKCGVSVKC